MSLKSHKSIRWLLIAIALFLVHTTASAQATRTWISGVGDDVNPCSRTAPCKTFAGAIAKTSAGGEIDTLDPGGFGTVTITKSITLYSDDSKNGGILATGVNGIIVNCTTDPNCVVVIRGLNINGGPTNTGLVGIKFIAGGALHIEDCHISQFNGGSPSGWGVSFVPSTGTNRLYIENSLIDDNGSAVDGGGINIAPTSTGVAIAEITNSQLKNNKGFGVFVGDNGFATIKNTNITGSQRSGVEGKSVSALFTDIVIENSVMTDDGWDQTVPEAGVLSSGANSFIHLSNNVISNNVNGMLRVSTGKILSYGNNKVLSNTTNGTPSGTHTQL